MNKLEKVMSGCFGIVVITQTILHYLGWLCILLGVVALLFQNVPRGVELVVAGVFWIALKYIIGICFHTTVAIIMKFNSPVE